MTADHNYKGFPRQMADAERVSYPPKDESWKDFGNCLGLEPSMFFPSRGDDTSAARAVCRQCVVRRECLEYALTPPFEAWGIWGGTSERERRVMRVRRSA